MKIVEIYRNVLKLIEINKYIEIGERTMNFHKFLFSFYLFLSVSLISAAPPGTFFADGNKNKKAVALTFDDGPGHFTVRVLDLLDRHKIKATFFMNGDQVELRPQIAKEVLKRGHEIADHTYSHMNFYQFEKKHGPDKANEKIKEEIKKSKEIIEKTTGISPKLCRMPHGYHRQWLKETAKEFGYVLVNWTFGEDWLKVTEEKMVQDYIRHSRPRAILLFHDGGNKREKTLGSLPKIIEGVKNKNLSFMTVGELLE